MTHCQNTYQNFFIYILHPQLLKQLGAPVAHLIYWAYEGKTPTPHSNYVNQLFFLCNEAGFPSQNWLNFNSLESYSYIITKFYYKFQLYGSKSTNQSPNSETAKDASGLFLNVFLNLHLLRKAVKHMLSPLSLIFSLLFFFFLLNFI